MNCSPNDMALIPRLTESEAMELPVISQDEVCGRAVVCPESGCRRRAFLQEQPGSFCIKDRIVPRYLNACTACRRVLDPYVRVALWPANPTSPAPQPLEVPEALRSTTYV
jgi:hypothetical protein